MKTPHRTDQNITPPEQLDTKAPGQGVDRRKFLQLTASSSLIAAGSGLVSPVSWATPTTAGTAANAAEEKVVWSSCTVNCGSRCALRMHVVDNKITWVDTDNTGTDVYGDHQVRACLRGRSMRKRVYNPDRLKYPMKRVGKRGEGKFERISWEEALDTIAQSLKHTVETYGNEAVYIQYATGTLGGTLARSWPQGASLISRLMNCYGGYLNHYNTYSTAQITTGLSYTYGSGAGNSSSDIANTKLLVMFGNNPGETRMSGAGVIYHLTEARARSNARMIVIDPRYTDTSGGREDEWIPIRPGTDAALISALAYVLITENMVDQAFLDRYCVGYDEKTLPASAPANGHYKAYILGQGSDGIAKTPQWASTITGIPVDRIIKLAREIGQAKPCYITQGWGPQRHANGEMTARAVAALACLTGNVGINGGNSGAREGSYSIPFVRFPTLTNPVKDSISFYLWTEAVLRGQEMTATRDGVRGTDRLKTPIKFIWNYAGNCMINQHGDTNRTLEILQDESKCEMIVVIDNHMTASAKCADILLPDAATAEQADFCVADSAGNMSYVIFAGEAVPPPMECKTLYQMMSELSGRLGIQQQFTEGRTEEEWLRHIYAQSREKDPTLPTFEEFRAMGIYKRRDPNGHFIAHKAFRQDPEANPLPTPSGKIEIYSEKLAEIAATWELPEGDVISPIPEYAPTWEGPQDFETKKDYPLQLVGHHTKGRTHSTYHNIDLLRQAVTDAVWINPIDAAPRGIQDGDTVQVKSKRGVLRILAKVTPRIMPGVVSMGQGAWFQPDSSGVDVGGCVNTLTSLRPSPLAKGNPQHTNLVEIQKVA